MNLSIVIPLFNSEKTIELCLDAITSSKSNDDEIIVVNDCSSDQSLKLITKYNCKIIHHLENRGAGSSRNSGTKEAKNELIVFVDSDIIVTKVHLELIRNYFVEHEKVHTITAGSSMDKKGLNFFSDFKKVYMHYILKNGATNVNYVYGSLCATRKAGYVPWPEKIRLTEDSLWGYQQSQLGLEVHLLKQIEPIHLKEYSFLSLIKNDFQISSYFAQAFFDSKRWSTLYSSEAFGHTSKLQKLSVILSALILLIPVKEFSIFLIVLWLGINSDFFKFCLQERNFVFLIKSIAWYYLDCIVYFAGIIHGFSVSFGKKLNIVRESI